MDTYQAIIGKRDRRAFLDRPVPEVARLLGIPAGLAVNRVLGVGYPDPDRPGAHPRVLRCRRPLGELVHHETW
jgi:hypothetical protein